MSERMRIAVVYNAVGLNLLPKWHKESSLKCKYFTISVFNSWNIHTHTHTHTHTDSKPKRHSNCTDEIEYSIKIELTSKFMQNWNKIKSNQKNQNYSKSFFYYFILCTVCVCT